MGVCVGLNTKPVTKERNTDLNDTRSGAQDKSLAAKNNPTIHVSLWQSLRIYTEYNKHALYMYRMTGRIYKCRDVREGSHEYIIMQLFCDISAALSGASLCALHMPAVSTLRKHQHDSVQKTHAATHTLIKHTNIKAQNITLVGFYWFCLCEYSDFPSTLVLVFIIDFHFKYFNIKRFSSDT